MRALVKTVALSSMIVITNVQPGADAARGPDWPESARQEAVADIVAEDIGLVPLSRPNDILSNAAAIEFPKTASLNASAWAIAIPAYGPISLSLYGAGPALPADAAEADAPKAVVVEPAVAMVPAEKQVAPEIDIPLPSARPRFKTLRPAARVEQIKFEGPTIAPFAHVRFCLANPAECRERKVVFRGGPVKLTEAKRRELMRVNAEVNRDIIGTPAAGETVATEKWLISPERGDCNDYAVTKRSKLIAKGWPSRALLLAEVVVPWGEHHLVVVVRTDKGDLVLDSLNANLRTPAKTGYEWVRVESPVNPKYWSKVAQPATEVAAIDRRQAGRL